MSDDHASAEGEFGLVMPFVVCQPDGPFDGESFVAGWECGVIDAFLGTAGQMGATLERYVDPRIVPQLDLIAMRHGYKLTTEPWEDHEDEWTHATFTKAVAS